MLSSPIIDLAVGLTFVFGVTAALASLVTELIARFIGLRGAYLLSGLRELVDGGDTITDLRNAETVYDDMQKMMTNGTQSSAPPPSGQQSSALPPSAPPPPSGQQASAPPPSAPPPSAPPPSAPPPSAPPSGQQPSASPSVAAALLGGPILRNQGMAGQFTERNLKLDPSRGTGRLPKMTAYVKADTAEGADTVYKTVRVVKLWSQRRSLPSYISSKSFAEAVIDLVVPDAQGKTAMTAIQHNIEELLPESMPFRTSLEALVTNANGDVSRFRTSVEQWYDDHMDRVSGWYKRHVAKITIVVGTIVIVLLNLNALTIGRTLYTESTVSTAISTVASKAATCSGETNEINQDCLANLEGQLSSAASAGLPIGWGTVRDCTEPSAHCNWWDERGIFSQHGSSGWQLVLVLIGFLIMIISIVPGAQFWFGLLTKIGTLRATGPKPATVASNS